MVQESALGAEPARQPGWEPQSWLRPEAGVPERRGGGGSELRLTGESALQKNGGSGRWVRNSPARGQTAPSLPPPAATSRSLLPSLRAPRLGWTPLVLARDPPSASHRAAP